MLPARPKRGRGRPRRAGADEEILTVALAMLREKGYRELTVDAVAERANVAKTTVYRRWPSKGSLVAAALSPTSRDPSPNQGSLERDLTHILNDILALLRLGGDVGNDPELFDVLRAAILPDRARLLGILAGANVKRDPDLLADLLIAPLLLGRTDVEAVVEAVLGGAR
jgi:AcrR family transcriptional regulator